MSGKYIVSESSSMMRALETNLKQSQRVIDSLKRGTSQLTSSLQEGNLKGKTYGAARDYVLNVLNPLISKASEGISDGVSDLETYKYEDSQISHYGNIDVAKLKNEKKIKEASKRKVAGQRERLQHLPLSALAVASPMAYGAAVSGMFSFENSMSDSIKKIDEKLLAYETFNTNTNSLFSDTTAVFDALEVALNALNNINFNGTGSGLTITLPGNIKSFVSKVIESEIGSDESHSLPQAVDRTRHEKDNNVKNNHPTKKEHGLIDKDISDGKVGFEAYGGKASVGDNQNGVSVTGLEAEGGVGLMTPFSMKNKKGKNGKSRRDTNFGVGADAYVGLSAAEAEAHGQLGGKQFNTHGSVSGASYTADAKASLGVGRFTDKNGNGHVGVQAELGANAYVVEGEVKAGFTVVGVKVNVSGSAGVGLSAAAKAGVTADKAEAKFKLGPFGLGLSIGG